MQWVSEGGCGGFEVVVVAAGGEGETVVAAARRSWFGVVVGEVEVEGVVVCGRCG